MADKERYSDFSDTQLKWLWSILAVGLLLSVGAEFFVHAHAVFGIDGTFGFNAWFGFISCAAIVVVSKALGYVLKRRESYYHHEEK